MNGKLLYQIPVYSMSENAFVEKYNARFIGMKNADLIKQINYPRGVWMFNQIIGYITISDEKNDISFDVFKHVGKIYPFSGNRRYIQNLYCNGLHFRKEGLTNVEIARRIEDFISWIAKRHFKGKYIDMEIFYNTISFCDFQR